MKKVKKMMKLTIKKMMIKKMMIKKMMIKKMMIKKMMIKKMIKKMMKLNLTMRRMESLFPFLKPIILPKIKKPQTKFRKRLEKLKKLKDLLN
jgi:hypothetical protein